MKSLVLGTILFASCVSVSGYAADAAVAEEAAPAADTASIIGEEFKPISLDDTKAAAPAVAATETLPQAQPLTLKEAEIPVLTKVEGKKATVQSPFARIGISMLIMGALFFGLFKFTKYWQKKTGIKIDENNKIRVLTQHYLGPRKSLAIIRVAGETILIGVTDSNISHIKSLALLESEEVPTEVPDNFAQSLKSAGGEDAQENDSAWSTIRDRVSTKIKEMRPL